MKKLTGRQAATRMTLRLPHSLYEALKTAAAADGLPLNTYCLYVLSRHDICKANAMPAGNIKKDLTLPIMSDIIDI